MTTNATPDPSGPAGLRRVLTFWPLVLYGLGVIVGAGVYVATGTVIRRAGDAAPTAFLLAGIAAGLTGLCYAELGVRFPEASGSVAYVRHGFGSQRLAQLTGVALTLTVVLSTASIARGAVHYLLVLLPVPAPLLTVGLVGGFTAIALRGVRESVWLAAGMSVIELAGLLAATAAGLLAAPDYALAGVVPTSAAGWGGAVAGAFVAFFAFLGFETLANLGEEVRDPQTTLPRGILGAVGASILLYVLVATATVLADRGGDNPLLALFQGRVATAFAAVAAVAVANGVLVQIVMLARLFYGMARNAQLPAWLGGVNARTGVPGPATLLSGVLVAAVALAVPFEPLLVLTNGLTLAVFVLVDLALWRLHRTAPLPRGRFAAPRWVPPAAALVSLLLVGAEALA